MDCNINEKNQETDLVVMTSILLLVASSKEVKRKNYVKQ